MLINEHFDGTDTTDSPGMDARAHHGVFARIQSVLNQALSSTAWTAFTRPAVLASVVTGVLVVGIGVYGLSPLQQDGLNNATTPVRLTQSIPSDRLALAMVAGETRTVRIENFTDYGDLVLYMKAREDVWSFNT